MSLAQVPDEILQQLLYFVSPDDNLDSVQVLSRRLNRLANEPLLWRYHCRHVFRYWDAEHDFGRKLQENVSSTNWKDVFVLRRMRSARAARLFDSLVAAKAGRLKKFELICLMGYDAKDFLLEQCNANDYADDYLARRYAHQNIVWPRMGCPVADTARSGTIARLPSTAYTGVLPSPNGQK
jgi:F-box protein 21